MIIKLLGKSQIFFRKWEIPNVHYGDIDSGLIVHEEEKWLGASNFNDERIFSTDVTNLTCNDKDLF